MLKILNAVLLGLSVLILPGIASAHVAVTPDRIGIGATSLFSVSVPNESQQPMTGLSLDIPNNVIEVTPTAKAGWKITVIKNVDTVTKLTWARGSLQPGQREDFTFSAQAPATAGELDWKAYQTFADDSVTHWDQKPTGSDDATGNSGQYSVTSVVNDLSAKSNPGTSNSHNNLALLIAGLALGISLYGLLFRKHT